MRRSPSRAHLHACHIEGSDYCPQCGWWTRPRCGHDD